MVGIRVGLPVTQTDVRRRFVNPDGSELRRGVEGERMVSVGFTALREGTKRSYLDALPDPDAREQVEALAAFAAAGVVAEVHYSGPNYASDLEFLNATSNDRIDIAVYADALGEQQGQLMGDAVNRAGAVLAENDRGAWETVAQQLFERGCLDEKEIRRLIDNLPADG